MHYSVVMVCSDIYSTRGGREQKSLTSRLRLFFLATQELCPCAGGYKRRWSEAKLGKKQSDVLLSKSLQPLKQKRFHVVMHFEGILLRPVNKLYFKILIL